MLEFQDTPEQSNEVPLSERLRRRRLGIAQDESLPALRKDADKRTPDVAARVLKVASKLGVGQDLVERNLDEAERLTEDPKFDSKNHPAIARWMSQSPNHIAISRNDIEKGTLQEVEKTFYRIDDPLRPLTQKEKLDLADRRSKRRAQKRVDEIKDLAASDTSGGTIEIPTLDQAREVVRQEEIDDIEFIESIISGKGSVGFVEQMKYRMGENALFWVPFASGAVDAKKATLVYEAAKAVEAGTATEDQADFMLQYARVQAAMSRRGTNLGAKVGGILAELPAFAGEFVATGPVYRGAKAFAMKTGGEAAEFFINQAVRKVLSGKLTSTAANVAASTFAAGAQTAAQMPIRTAGSVANRMTPTGKLKVMDGELHYEVDPGSGEKFWNALPKSLVESFAEVASERTGKLFEVLDKPLNKALFGWFKAKYPGASGEAFQSFIQKAGIHGVLGEFGEERIGSLIKAFGGAGEFSEVIPSGEQAGAELLAFSALPFGSAALSRFGARKAIDKAEGYRRIGELLKESEVLGLSPEVTESLLEEIVSKAEMPFTYVNPDEWIEQWQSKGVDPKAKALEAGASEEAYIDALISGADIQFKTAKFARTVLPSEQGPRMADVMKDDPLEANAKEAAEFEKAQDKIEKAVEGHPIPIPEPQAIDRSDEDEIRRAIEIVKAEQEIKPLFNDPKVVEATLEAKAHVELELREKLRKQRESKRSKLWKDRYAVVRGEVDKDVSNRKIYRDIHVIENGTTVDGRPVDGAAGGLKLNRKILNSRYTPEFVQKIPKHLLSFEKDGGVDPDYAAEVLSRTAGRGYTSGDELLKRLIETPSKEDLIELLTTGLMKAEFGDMLSDGSLSEEAFRAIHNDKQAEVYRAELKHMVSKSFATVKKLLRQIVGKVPTVKAERARAEAFIRSRKVSEINPNLYRAKEASAAREAVKEALAGNWQAAFDAKLKQFINHERLVAAMKAVDEINSIVDYMRKFGKDSVRAKFGKAGERYLDQIDAIAARYEFRRVSASTLADRVSLAQWIAKEEEETKRTPNIPKSVLNEARQVNYKDATFEELTEIRDAAKNIEHLAETKNRLMAERRERDLEATAEKNVKSIVEHAKSDPARSVETKAQWKRMLQGYWAAHQKFAMIIRGMDGWKDGGPLWDSVVRPQNEAANREATETGKAAEKLRELFSVYSWMDLKKMQWNKEYIPELRDSMTKMRVLMMGMNWGNLDSRQKLIDGLSVTYGRVVTEAEVFSVMDRMLDERDWKFIQSVWDYIDGFWPETKALALRVDGIAPDKVESAPFETKHGEIRGGYFPLKYDATQSQRTHEDEAREAADRMKRGASFRATTRHGHREARVSGVQRPIRLDFSAIFQHVGEVIHDQTHYEYILDANRLLGHPDVQNAIRHHYGDLVLKELQKTLDDIAGGDLQAQNGLDQALNKLRRHTTTAILGFKATTALVQPLGLTLSAVRIGPQWLARGLSRWVGDAVHMENSARMILEKSEMMRNRFRTKDREVNEIRNQLRLTGKAMTIYQSAALWLTARMQRVADIPTWLGAYEKAVAESKNASSLEDASEIEARSVALADQAVLDSQGGGQVKDLASIARGSAAWRLFTMFSNFYITRLNLTREVFGRAKLTPAAGLRLAMDLILLYPAPVIAAYFIKQALKGGDDDEKDVNKILLDVGLDPLDNFMFVREVGSAIKFGEWKGPAGAKVIGETADFAIQAAQAIEEGETDEAFWRSLNDAGGIYFSYPSSQLDATIRGLKAFEEGDAGPGAVLLGPPPKR